MSSEYKAYYPETNTILGGDNHLQHDYSHPSKSFIFLQILGKIHSSFLVSQILSL
jgi:hypothetical protein